MSTRTSPSPNGESGSLRLQMERSIDRLADAARNGVDAAEFFSQALNSALESGGAHEALLWRRSAEGPWQLAGELPATHRNGDFTQQRQSMLEEASKTTEPFLKRLNKQNSLESTDSVVLSPIRHARNTVGILETRQDVNAAGQLPADTLAFYTALCEITADYLSQQELEQLRRARATWELWDQYFQTLWHSLDLAAVCVSMANDGRLLADCDRVSVLIRQDRTYRLIAVSGVSAIDSRSSVTRSLEALAEFSSRQTESVWLHVAQKAEVAQVPPDLGVILDRYVLDSGVTGIGLVPVSFAANEQSHAKPSAVVVFENFHSIEEVESWKVRSEYLVTRSRPVLKAAIERSEIPWLGLWQRLRRLPDFWLSTRTICAVLLIVIMAGALVCIPADFTVSGTAELWPAQRRDVFAASSGIVDRIFVAHGDEVAKDQPLIILRDPDLELEAPRILGEIATLNERLKGVQAARFIGSNSPESALRARQLTADEEELKERLQTLERQRALIEERLKNLTLSSPIAGKVLTWDVDQLLSARPVERGQMLLTVGNTAESWIVEVRVADKDAGPLLRARKQSKEELSVDFLLPSEPGRTYHGRIQDVALSCDTDDAAHSFLRVIVAFDREQMEQPRAGATAIPRIHCGRRSLGYIWLRDVIDLIRTRLLF